MVVAHVMFCGEVALWLTKGVGGKGLGMLTDAVSSTQIPTGELLVDIHGETSGL